MTPPPHSPPKIHPSCRREASLLGTKDEKDATNPAALLILERENNSIIFPGVQQYALFCIIPIGQKALKQEESKDQSEKMVYLFCRMASVSPWSRRVQGSNREVQSWIKSRSPGAAWFSPNLMLVTFSGSLIYQVSEEAAIEGHLGDF